jgi:hypothetical protein
MAGNSLALVLLVVVPLSGGRSAHIHVSLTASTVPNASCSTVTN